MDKNIVLIGMMGCGKSTAGELLARRLGRPLADTDAVIEQRQGRAIPEIFARDGEAGFRALELELCRELSGQGGLVIACGGGHPGGGHRRAEGNRRGVLAGPGPGGDLRQSRRVGPAPGPGGAGGFYPPL